MNRTEIVQSAMDRRRIGPRDLAKETGVAYTTIRSMLERDFVNASIDNTSRICKALGLTLDDLIGGQSEGNVRETNYEYIVHPVSAGLPESVEGVADISDIAIPDSIMGKYAGQADIKMMRINGESMNRVIPDKSLIAVKRTALCNIKDGDIVVYNDNYEYAVKRMYRAGDNVIFRPDSHNPAFTDYVTAADEHLDIIGKVVIYIVELD